MLDTERAVADTIPSLQAPSASSEVLPPGARIGRYLLLSLEARGGMGLVYRAHDPELSRNVALKLLRPDKIEEGMEAEYEDRLRREAQSLAQLAHPNVVAAYDVGLVDGRIFMAMEYVEGKTVDRWLREEVRSWREVMAIFCAAGRGLAAAHAAGLVHRDFKPDNVLLGRDGRPRVADFGLARLGPHTPRSENHLSLDLTAEGIRLGTPSYMSPEQHRGQNATPASDQFSFCVALHFGLYRQLPFTGDDWDKIAAACTEGRMRPPPRGTKVPRRLYAIIKRGLSVDPADRYPSMDALLDALGHDPATPRRRAALFASSLALVASAAAVAQHFSDAGRVCRGAEQKLQGIWDLDRKITIQRGLSRTGAPHASASFEEVARTFDRFAEGWIAMHTDACEATRVRGDQTEEILGLRMACLDGRLREMRALGDRFAEADVEVAQNAVRAVQGLPALASCADLRALTGPIPPPSDPELKRRIAAIEEELARIRSFEQTGRYREGLDAARRAADDAEKIGYRPLEAEAFHLLGLLSDAMGDFPAAEKNLRSAVWSAEAGRADELAARAWIGLIRVVGERLGKREEANTLVPRVTAALERSGGDEEIEASLLSTLATIALFQGQYADAERDFAKSLSLLERRFGPEDLRVVDPVRRLAFIAAHRDQSDRSLELLRRALAIQEKVYDQHPEIAATLETIANAEYMAGRYRESEAAFVRALEIRERALGKEHVSVANTLHNLAVAIYLNTGRGKEAIAMVRRAVALDEKLVGPEHPSTLRHLQGLAYALQGEGHPGEALAILERVLPVLEKQNGREHPIIAECLQTMSNIYLLLDRPLEARAAAFESHRMNERMLGPDYNSSWLLRVIARAELALGEPARAIEPLTQAREHHLGKKDDLGELAWTNSLLGQALYDSKRDRLRGKSLVREALAYMKSDPRLEAEQQQLVGWMKRRRVR